MTINIFDLILTPRQEKGSIERVLIITVQITEIMGAHDISIKILCTLQKCLGLGTIMELLLLMKTLLVMLREHVFVIHKSVNFNERSKNSRGK